MFLVLIICIYEPAVITSDMTLMEGISERKKLRKYYYVKELLFEK